MRWARRETQDRRDDVSYGLKPEIGHVRPWRWKQNKKEGEGKGDKSSVQGVLIDFV